MTRLSPTQQKVLLAIDDLCHPRWWHALDRAHRIYGAYVRLSSRTLSALREKGLVEQYELRDVQDGAYHGNVYALTVKGGEVALLLRRAVRHG